MFKTKQDLHITIGIIAAFAAFICGIQNEESSLWWIPTGVLGLLSIYFWVKVAGGGGSQE